MDYHYRIMNLPLLSGNALVDYLRTLQTYMDYKQAYAYGHRDARNAAAEIAAQADARIAELEGKLQAARPAEAAALKRVVELEAILQSPVEIARLLSMGQAVSINTYAVVSIYFGEKLAAKAGYNPAD